MTRPDGRPLEARVGVNTGEALVRLDVNPGSGRASSPATPSTSPPASRPRPARRRRRGRLTHELTSRAIVYEELPPVVAKGKAEPVLAWLAEQPRGRTGLRTSGSDDALPRPPRPCWTHCGTPCDGSRVRGSLLPHRRRARHRQEPPSTRARQLLDKGPGLVTWRGDVLALRRGLPSGPSGDRQSARRHPRLRRRATSRRSSTPCCPRVRTAVASPASASPARPRSAPGFPRGELRRLAEVSRPHRVQRPDRHRPGGPALGRQRDAGVRPGHGQTAPLRAGADIGTTRPELLEKHPDFLDDQPSANCITLPSLERSAVGAMAAALLGGKPSGETWIPSSLARAATPSTSGVSQADRGQRPPPAYASRHRDHGRGGDHRRCRTPCGG